ncbi:TfoX/Sxy family DNA transformation protein [Vibrio coralliirubri]|uniref:TfoX/Sxy family DNA transformation protein n=1 Tax=Vibrio coralliirubri TaxID=1516159 RepID=UPI0022837AB7|nr:TfoX/Sxy family DNA transformation protein [Vibrio coralliirubri]MCY9863802.1 TfoX/Sxy family DNA transformation protein [Vibrio coralliirubri]
MTHLFRQTFKRLESLGRVSIKHIFGVTAFYVDNVLLVVHKSGELYLRGTSAQEGYFINKGYPKVNASTLGVCQNADYYKLSADPWGKYSLPLCEAEVALNQIKRSRSSYLSAPERLKDLPNMRFSTEQLLEKAGINSIEKLKNLGTIGAVEAIQQHTHHKPTIELFWSIEGAIQGVHRSQLPTQLKSALRTQAQSYC